MVSLRVFKHNNSIWIIQIPERESLVPLDADKTDTVVIANVPGWCYKTFTYKLADDLEKRDGIFRAGPVKMYINVVGLVAGSQIGLLDRYSKEGFQRLAHRTLDGANVILKTFASLSIIISR